MFFVFKFRESRGGFWFAWLPLYSVHFPRQRILALSQLWRICSCNLQYNPFPHFLDSLLCVWLLNSMHLASFYPPYHFSSKCSSIYVCLFLGYSFTCTVFKFSFQGFHFVYFQKFNLFFKFCQVFKIVSFIITYALNFLFSWI